MANNKFAQYKAYNLATQTVNKTRQVVMLYDGAIRFMKQAKQAIEERRYSDRYVLLVKVSEILMGLQASLDFENGGEAAEILYSFYSTINAKIMSIHHNNSLETCDEIIKELKETRELWDGIDRSHAEAGRAGETATAAATTLTESNTKSSQQNASHTSGSNNENTVSTASGQSINVQFSV